MKVALIGLRLSVGIRLIADSLAGALRRLGVEVIFLGEQAYRAPEGVPTIAVSDGSSYRAMLRDSFRPVLYREAVNALKSAQPDICYFMSVHPANAGLAWAIRREVRDSQGRRPVIAMHLHDPLPHPGLASLTIFATQQVQVRMADRVVVYGAELARQVQRYYRVPLRRIAVIRHGASRPPRETPPVDSGGNGGFQWFSFLGRIEPYKGLEVFLGAARRLHAENPKARFFVGGAGDLARYRSSIEELGTSITVEHRELSNEETDDVMRSSWAVVLPYNSATQSGVIPVAYWNACPVIVTRVGGLREVVREGETGFIVDRGDAMAVAERMRALAGNHALRWRLGGGAFSFYDRWLRWERIANDLLTALSR
ncbi:MAG: glycosyltransferase family 4 protein [Gemmatimonadetes bacterium]|nr:glycosyltransferase family 4 protein [Gemmatimonadota bacterium]